MKKYIKAGILAIVLVLPVFLLLFLYKFGNNQFKIPVYFAYDSNLVGDEYVITDAHHIPDFKFLTQDSQYFSNKDLKGSIYVTDFFFTRCPGICKDMSSQLTRVQDYFRENKEIKIVSFSVDPENDKPSALKTYADRYRAVPDKWYFLTGSKDSLYKLAKEGFFLNALEDKNSKEEFIHDNHFVLVDKEGRIRGFYDGTSKKDVDRLITEVSILLEEYEKK
ncbi:MAG: SCO family protein [Cytophagaceae bacterium]|nr:SCO family protein [Cytophagaceae bacterium]